MGADPDAAEERSVPCDNVPATVRTAFGKSFPKATVRSCVKEEEMGKSAYELTSTEGETTRDVLFDPDGALLVVEEADRCGISAQGGKADLEQEICELHHRACRKGDAPPRSHIRNSINEPR